MQREMFAQLPARAVRGAQPDRRGTAPGADRGAPRACQLAEAGARPLPAAEPGARRAERRAHGGGSGILRSRRDGPAHARQTLPSGGRGRHSRLAPFELNACRGRSAGRTSPTATGPRTPTRPTTAGRWPRRWPSSRTGGRAGSHAATAEEAHTWLYQRISMIQDEQQGALAETARDDPRPAPCPSVCLKTREHRYLLEWPCRGGGGVPAVVLCAGRASLRRCPGLAVQHGHPVVPAPRARGARPSRSR